MWPFALLSIGVIPFMGFATALEMKRFLGEDEGGEVIEDGNDSPGGIIVETLLNIRTVSALTLEEQRLKDYERALEKSEGMLIQDSAISGALSGLSIGIQQVSDEVNSHALISTLFLTFLDCFTRTSGPMLCSFGGEDGSCSITQMHSASRTS